MKTPSVEDIIAIFPHPILPMMQGEPDYHTIHATRKLLQANARSIDSYLEGGALGHLGLIVSVASYAIVDESKSSAGGFFYMGNNNKTDKNLTNGAIVIISKVIKHVLSSAAEAEIGAVFINAKEGAVLRTTLEELGHEQPPTSTETDDTTATGYSNVKIKQKRTKAMDIR
jgi:hypothetical protein